MTVRDLVEISAGNLWRMKLRTCLTLAGVVIAIGAFVAMVSFGAGAEKNVSEEYEKLGLFTTMQVYPPAADSLGDSVPPPPLTDSVVARLARLPGVRLAYPYDAFSVSVRLDTLELSAEAQVLPPAAVATRLYSRLVAGRRPDANGSREAMVTREFLEDHALGPADSILGRSIAVSVSSSTLDSAVVHVVRQESRRVEQFIDAFDFDSLDNVGYLRRTATGEFNAAARSFLEGYLGRPMITTDTLTIVGVIDGPQGRRLRVKPLIIPEQSARRFAAAKSGPDPAELLAAFQSGRVGNLFGGDTAAPDAYSRVTLDLEPGTGYAALSDSIRAMGYETFSYLEQFAEIQRFFLYFDLMLGVVGMIALVTASLGIVNTMVMSILERRREIGVLKSLGADDRDVWLQFLAESGVIGSVGAVLGILLGWVVTRIASFVAVRVMENQGMTAVELFDLPLWLIAVALLFGTAVSVAAGLYPAARAARVNPVEALRNE